jgi:hypothetical protein
MICIKMLNVVCKDWLFTNLQCVLRCMFTSSGKELLRLHKGQNIWDHSEGCDKKTLRWLSFTYLTLPFQSGHAVYNADISKWLLI